MENSNCASVITDNQTNQGNVPTPRMHLSKD
jgi:hypothetical protein